MTLIRMKPRSEARDRLAAAIEARRDHQAELSAISASLARLSDLAARPAKIEQAIAAIDASGGAALAAWAKSGDGPAPTPNAEKRAELVADLWVAKASAGPAEAAYTGIAATYNAVVARAKAHDDAISAAVIAILADELAPVAAKAQAIASELASIRDAVIEGAAFARGLSMKIGAGPAVVSTELTACQKALDTAIANPPTDFGALAAVKSAWSKLAADLAAGDDGVFFSVASGSPGKRGKGEIASALRPRRNRLGAEDQRRSESENAMTIVDRIAKVRARVDAMPPGAARAKLRAELTRAATDLANMIRAAAKAKKQ